MYMYKQYLETGSLQTTIAVCVCVCVLEKRLGLVGRILSTVPLVVAKAVML